MSASAAESGGDRQAVRASTSREVTPLPAGLPSGEGVWVALPTYNERDNLEPMVSAILAALPRAHVLVVDDNSPDGTGALADELAAREPRLAVLHRPGKQGLGAAYRDAFRSLLARDGVAAIIQMDCDFSHDPADLPRLLQPLTRGADLVLGTRYIRGGSTPGWGLMRRMISRGGTTFARTLLLLPYRDLTGGFKAWRRDLLATIRLREVEAHGYGFQVEMTWWAHRRGARIVQIPIVFRERAAGASKMRGAIVAEALLMVVRLRVQTLPLLRHGARPPGD